MLDDELINLADRATAVDVLHKRQSSGTDEVVALVDSVTPRGTVQRGVDECRVIPGGDRPRLEVRMGGGYRHRSYRRLTRSARGLSSVTSCAPAWGHGRHPAHPQYDYRAGEALGARVIRNLLSRKE